MIDEMLKKHLKNHMNPQNHRSDKAEGETSGICNATQQETAARKAEGALPPSATSHCAA
jgi:hypothetical protein